MTTPTSPLCPSCNRYIGPVRRCPYCNADAFRSPMMRAIRWIALLLATAGLLCLYVAARHHDPPTIQIDTITPVMNFAHVSLAGRIPRKPYISADRNYVSFLLDDTTGTIRVAAYRNIAHALLSNNTLPESGNRVTVRGTLNLSAHDMPKLYLRNRDHLQIVTDSDTPNTP